MEYQHENTSKLFIYLFTHFLCVCVLFMGLTDRNKNRCHEYAAAVGRCIYTVWAMARKKKQTKLECVHVKHKVYRQLKPNTHTTCFEWVQRAYIAVYRIVASQCERLFFIFALDKWKAYSTVCIRNPIVYSIYECTRYWYGKQSIWTEETTTTTKNNRIIYSHWGWVLGNDSKIRYFHVFIVIK